MKIFNINGNEPLIYHFNGQKDNIKLNGLVEQENLVCPEDLTIIFPENDMDTILKDNFYSDNRLLPWQIEHYNLPYINGFFTSERFPSFELLYKIAYNYNALRQVETKYTLILDYRDTSIRTFSNIIEKFQSTKTKILFGTEKINFGLHFTERENGNVLHNSEMRFLNSGAAMGYTDDCRRFWEYMMDDIINKDIYPNDFKEDIFYPNTGEYYPQVKGTDQGFIRIHLDDFEKDFVNVDYESKIFINLGNANMYIN